MVLICVSMERDFNKVGERCCVGMVVNFLFVVRWRFRRKMNSGNGV